MTGCLPELAIGILLLIQPASVSQRYYVFIAWVPSDDRQPATLPGSYFLYA